MAWSDPRTWTTGETVTAAHLNQEIRDNLDALFPDGIQGDFTDGTVSNVWEPALSDDGGVKPLTGGSITGGHYRIGPLVVCHVQFIAAGFDATSGVLRTNLPFTADSQYSTSMATAAGQAVGGFVFRDASTLANSVSGIVLLRSTNTVQFQPSGTSPLQVDTDTDDRLSWWATYMTDMA